MGTGGHFADDFLRVHRAIGNPQSVADPATDHLSHIHIFALIVPLLATSTRIGNRSTLATCSAPDAEKKELDSSLPAEDSEAKSTAGGHAQRATEGSGSGNTAGLWNARQ